MSRLASLSRLAMTLRMVLLAASVKACFSGAAAPDATTIGTLPALTASTSFLTMRPCGPDPLIRPRSSPACSAMRLANGLANSRSPSFLCRSAGLPSVMVGVLSLAVANGLGRFDDIFRTRQRQGLQIGGIGHGRVGAGNAEHRGVQIVKSLLHHQGGDLGADSGERPPFLNAYQPVCFFNRSGDGVDIQRPQGA